MKYRISALLAAAAFAVTLSVSFFSAEAQEQKEGVQKQFCISFTSEMMINKMAENTDVALVNRLVGEGANNFLSFSFEGGSSIETDLVLVYNRDDNNSLFAGVFLNGCAIFSKLWPAFVYNNTMEKMAISNRKTISERGPWPMFRVESN